MIAATKFGMQLKAELDKNGLIVSSMELSPHANSAIHVTVDGKFCVTSIGLWPNGLMDVDCISLLSEKETCTHRELDLLMRRLPHSS